MIDTLPRHDTRSPVTDRRRPGRMENPSPELIALMRKPGPQAVAQVALYDAPNFVVPREVAAPSVNPMHMVRMLAAGSLCVAGWAGAFGVMVFVWG